MKNEMTWEEAVNNAKLLIASDNKKQMKIAELALSVCEIHYGGKIPEGTKTLTEFAKEIGMSFKTLTNWCAVYKTVFKALTKDEQATATMGHLFATSKRVGRKATKKRIREVYQELSKSDFETTMRRYCESLRGLAYNIDNKQAISICTQKTIEEIFFYTHHVSSEIKLQKPNYKPINHDVAYGESAQRSRLPALDGKIQRLTFEHDRIYNRIKQVGRPVSPTALGLSIGKKKTKMAAKLWALRRLEKLVEEGYLKKEKRGMYEINNERSV